MCIIPAVYAVLYISASTSFSSKCCMLVLAWAASPLQTQATCTNCTSPVFVEDSTHRQRGTLQHDAGRLQELEVMRSLFRLNCCSSVVPGLSHRKGA